MALLGSLGGLLGALGGEVLFLDSDPEEEAPGPREVCLVFDLSESMRKRTSEGVSQLEALSQAAAAFVSAHDFAGDTFSLVGFSDDARLLVPPSGPEAIRAALAGLGARGRTDIGRGLEEARRVLDSAGDGAAARRDSWIVLFTDGKPQTGRLADPAEEARQAARACRDSGIQLVAVGTGLAERALLEDLTGDPASVFLSAPEGIGEAFRRSREHIQGRQMLVSAPAAIELEASLHRACGWAALVALGTGLALVGGHNRHLRRRASMPPAQIAMVVLGAAASGFVAGVAGQGTFYALSESATLEPAVRTVAWILLGSGVVLGMSFFVPNLPRGRALAGGALGGAAAVAAFLRIVPEVGDTPGRLLGATILGCMAGAMTVLVQASVRRAWLVVRWPRGETTTLLLGATPIVVGHSARAHICPAYDEAREPVIGTFTLSEGSVRFEERASGRIRALRGGERLTFDPVVVEVHAERTERSTPAPPTPVAPGPRPRSDAPDAALPRERRERKLAHRLPGRALPENGPRGKE